MRLILVSLFVLVGCSKDIPQSSQSPANLESRLVVDNEQVSVEGEYSIAGKFGPYIRVGGTQVYLVSDESASWPDLGGQRVRVSGSLDLAPAVISPSDDIAGAPARLLLTTTPEAIQQLK